jgi:hypothetical protein
MVAVPSFRTSPPDTVMELIDQVAPGAMVTGAGPAKVPPLSDSNDVTVSPAYPDTCPPFRFKLGTLAVPFTEMVLESSRVPGPVTVVPEFRLNVELELDTLSVPEFN